MSRRSGTTRGPEPPAEPQGRLGGRCLRRRRQAARHRGPPGARPPRRDARRVAGHPPSRLGPARGPPPRPRHVGPDAGRQGRRRAARAPGRAAAARGAARVPGPRDRPARVAHGDDRCADRPGRTPPDAHVDPHGHAAGGPHPLRGRAVRRHAHARAGTARDRPHAPDQGPFRRDRASRSRATAITGRATSSASSASSSTARGWPCLRNEWRSELPPDLAAALARAE